MRIDLNKIPFSKYGSYLSITRELNGYDFMLRNCRQLFGEEQYMLFRFYDMEGNLLVLPVDAELSCIVVGEGDQSAIIALRGDEEIIVTSVGLHVRIEAKAGWCYQVSESEYRFHQFINHNYTMNLAVLQGHLKPHVVMEVSDDFHQNQIQTEFVILPDAAGKLEFGVLISPLEVEYQRKRLNMETECKATIHNWESFHATRPEVAKNYEEVADLLWYNLWSSVIRAGGYLKYDAMLMSKSTMCAVWPWDHCFNSLGLLKGGHERGALEQFFLPFELQSREGKLPDILNTEVLRRNCVKPPIHGWCFGKIMDKVELTREVLEKAYRHLELWTNWHFQFRDSDGDGIPEYVMGFDSGWDNSTVFDLGSNIESPDLSAYLILQMKTLARIADKLGNHDMQQYWHERASQLLKSFLEHSCVNGIFVAKQSGTHYYEALPSSLLTLMPVVLGTELPKNMFESIVKQIEEHHVTEYGLATESIHSPKYQSDGYWRGPIWAPTTYLVIDGLQSGGYPSLARKIAFNFCKTVSKNGTYENYDALTGRGLRDPGYTWTSSVALCLMNEYQLSDLDRSY
jgi:putative isomerase